MPDIELQGRHQVATLWEASGVDKFGDAQVLEPVEIDVRWEQTRKEAVDNLGNPTTVDAEVIVAQDIPVGSLLRLGAIEDIPDEDNPDALMVLIFISKTPDTKGRVYHRRASLQFFSDTIPTVVSS